MSKGKAKVEIEDDKANKNFENTPKLFNKWSYDELKVKLSLSRSKTHASSTTLPSSPPSHRFTSPTPPEDIKPRGSEKHYAPLSKDSSAPCNSQAETPERKSRLSESSGTPSRSFTSSPGKTPLRSLSEASSWQAPEKTPPVSEPEVSSGSKPWTCLPLEESTRLST